MVVIIDTVLKTPARTASLALEHVLVDEPDDHDQRGGGEQRERDLELLVAAEHAELAADDPRVEQREVRARDDHEDDDHPLRRGANGSIERGSGEKPAVAIVANEIATAL